MSYIRTVIIVWASTKNSAKTELPNKLAGYKIPTFKVIYSFALIFIFPCFLWVPWQKILSLLAPAADANAAGPYPVTSQTLSTVGITSLNDVLAGATSRLEPRIRDCRLIAGARSPAVGRLDIKGARK